METRHGVTTCICNFLHFRELIFAACRKIEKGKLVKVLCLLIGFLNDLFRCELRIKLTNFLGRLCGCLASGLVEQASPNTLDD
jgi:hypothetical protein